MKHWVDGINDRVDIKSEEFFNEIETVCRKYGVSISHEDGHGAFIIQPFEKFYTQWLMDASFTKEAYEIFLKQQQEKGDL